MRQLLVCTQMAQKPKNYKINSVKFIINGKSYDALSETFISSVNDDIKLIYDLMIEKSNRLGDVMNLIDEKSFRWMELDEIGA